MSIWLSGYLSIISLSRLVVGSGMDAIAVAKYDTPVTTGSEKDKRKKKNKNN